MITWNGPSILWQWLSYRQWGVRIPALRLERVSSIRKTELSASVTTACPSAAAMTCCPGANRQKQRLTQSTCMVSISYISWPCPCIFQYFIMLLNVSFSSLPRRNERNNEQKQCRFERMHTLRRIVSVQWMRQADNPIWHQRGDIHVGQAQGQTWNGGFQNHVYHGWRKISAICTEKVYYNYRFQWNRLEQYNSQVMIDILHTVYDFTILFRRLHLMTNKQVGFNKGSTMCIHCLMHKLSCYKRASSYLFSLWKEMGWRNHD